jgi:hypothetical protein
LKGSASNKITITNEVISPMRWQERIKIYIHITYENNHGQVGIKQSTMGFIRNKTSVRTSVNTSVKTSVKRGDEFTERVNLWGWKWVADSGPCVYRMKRELKMKSSYSEYCKSRIIYKNSEHLIPQQNSIFNHLNNSTGNNCWNQWKFIGLTVDHTRTWLTGVIQLRLEKLTVITINSIKQHDRHQDWNHDRTYDGW